MSSNSRPRCCVRVITSELLGCRRCFGFVSSLRLSYAVSSQSTPFALASQSDSIDKKQHAMSALARAGYTVSAAQSTANAAPVAPPTFPPNTQPLQAPNYALAIPAAGELTAQTLLRHVQQSGALEAWLADMEAEACEHSDGAAPLSADALSAFEERLLSRLLTFVDHDPEVRSLLSAVERADRPGAPPKLHELVRDVNQRCQRTILAPAQHSRSYRAAEATSILPELHTRCSQAFRHIAYAAPRPSDPIPSTANGTSSARADGLLAAAAEHIVLTAQNEEVTRSNRLHEAAVAMRIVL